ncbi:septum formation initiator family protein [Candidatus Falkowbacteria bacterium]|nr:septum formation initiator family protein [Candidatus Falkowbacteria bacterium]
MYNQDSRLKNFLSSKFFFIISLVVLVLVGFALTKIIYRRLQIKKETTKLEQKIKDLEKNNFELTQLTDYLNTNAYKEKAARGELGLKKPDENVVVIIKEESTKTAIILDNNIIGEDTVPNHQKWWQYFFN